MFFSRLFFGAIVLAAASEATFAQTDNELDPRLYDANGNGVLEQSEAEIWLMHKSDKTLAKYDLDRDGQISQREARAIVAESAKTLAKRKDEVAYEALYFSGNPVSRVEASIPKSETFDPCKTPQQLYIRRDRLDTFQYRNVAPGSTLANVAGQPNYAVKEVTRAEAKGASFSYNRDEIKDTDQLNIKGRAALVVARLDPNCAGYNTDPNNPFSPPDPNAPFLFGYTIAPWIDAQGSLTSPRKSGEFSSLQAGVDAQLAIGGGPLLDLQYFVFSPYYQTDFEGEAHIAGFRAGWEPFSPYDLRLGGRLGVPDPYVDWFWQARAEVDFKSVSDPGNTNLDEDHYAWLGGIVRANINLFPDRSKILSLEGTPFAELTNRVYASGTFQWHYDAYAQRAVHMYGAEIGYNLTTDGKSSVSVQYNKGTDKDTLEKKDMYVLGLNFKY